MKGRWGCPARMCLRGARRACAGGKHLPSRALAGAGQNHRAYLAPSTARHAPDAPAPPADGRHTGRSPAPPWATARRPSPMRCRELLRRGASRDSRPTRWPPGGQGAFRLDRIRQHVAPLDLHQARMSENRPHDVPPRRPAMRAGRRRPMAAETPRATAGGAGRDRTPGGEGQIRNRCLQGHPLLPKASGKDGPHGTEKSGDNGKTGNRPHTTA